MKRGNLQYLSRRLIGIGTAALVLIVLLLTALCAAAASLGGYWLLLPGAGVLALALLLLAAAAWIVRPFLRLEKEMRQSLEGHTGLPEEETVFLTPAIRQALEYLRGMPAPSELMKLNKRQAQYLALQNQINPHFLYNTLESIRSEALVAGLTALAEMTEALASFFRYTISKVEDLVSVEEELQNCETYFKIQQYRFAERLQLTVECDSGEREEIYNCRLP